MGYYYQSPSGLGTWYVRDNQTPQEALNQFIRDTGANVSNALLYATAVDPVAHQLRGGAPPPPTSPPPPRSIAAKPKIENTVPPSVQPDCPAGFFYDEFNDVCVPVETTPIGPVGTGTGTITTVTPVSFQVTVNNAVDLSSSAITAITDTVKSAIDDGISAASDAANKASKTIIDDIKTVADNIGQGVSSLLQGLKDGLGYIAGLVWDNIGTLVGFIKDHIGSIIDATKNVINNVIIPVVKDIQAVINKINDVVSNTIAPVFNTISQIYQQTNALIQAIKDDVKNGLAGLLQLPNDITNALGSIDASLTRVATQLGGQKKDGTTVGIYQSLDENVGTHLLNLSSILKGTSKASVGTSTIAPELSLTDPSINDALGKAFDAIWREIVTFITNSISGYRGFSGALKSIPLIIPFVAEAEWELPAALIGFVLAMLEAYRPALQFIEEDIAAKTGLAKLDSASALEAWRRKIITDKSVEEELAVNGWDSGRRQVLLDLQRFLIGVTDMLDLWHRGIVSEEDMRANLAEHGVDKVEQDALVLGSYKLIDPATAITGWRYGIINDQALQAVLSTNKYSDDEIKLVFDTVVQPERVIDVLDRLRRGYLQNDFLINDTIFNTTPAAVKFAARAEGLSFDVADDLWQSQFQIPPLQQWLSLFFRGKRTLKELQEAFRYYRIPDAFWGDYIDANHALIPFRTIPKMLELGIISDAYARQQLHGHGYDLPAINALLDYARATSAGSKTKQASDLKAISEQVARKFWDDHAISDQQYHDILLAHGEDETTAKLTMDAYRMERALRERKQAAQDIINEASSGLFDDVEAQRQLNAMNFTQAEQARYMKDLRSVRRANAKMPTEAELLKFFKAGVIDANTYAIALGDLGYPDKWVSAFVELNITPAPAGGA